MRLLRIIKHPVRKLLGKSGRHVRRAPAGIKIPQTWWKRWLWYINPKRFRDFWFTKYGGIAALKIIGIWFGIGVAFVAALFLYFAKDLPTPGQVNSRILAQTTRFYDRTGQHLLYEVHGDQNRTVIELENISPYIRNATVAIEDRNFYRHGAFSSLGILRAAINNVLNRDQQIQGGSTITQQYVKNALLSPERTFTRKVKELILSIQIEQLYAKEDILELYLNEIPYGAQAYGVQAAAKTYFSKDAKDLTADEAALLAALPKAPTYYSPYGEHLDELFARQDLILDLMRDQGLLSAEESEAAKQTDTYAKVNEVPDLYANVTAPHFVLYAESYLKEKLGERQVSEGGLHVITSLDVDIQKKAEEAVAAGIGVIDRAGGNNAALVAGNPENGEVMAMVGSRGFNHPGYGSFNAALARRQPGSSFKPYVYAAGFKTGKWGPGSVMYDVRTDFGGGYVPNNYDNRFHGAMTIRHALGNSFNIPAVKMLYIVGLQEALDTAHSMGITTLDNPEDYGLSLVLGAGEIKLADHVNGYETFANGGLHYEASPIIKATTPKGEVAYEHKGEGKRVLDPQIAYLMTNILSDPAARSITFGSSAKYMTIPGQSAFVKTGTTDKNRDGWMIGGSKHLVAGVWVGHSDNKAMSGITSTLTGTIWAPFMAKAHEGKENKPFDKPEGLKNVTLDRTTGKLPGQGSSGSVTDIFPAWFTPQPSPGPQTATVDKVSGKLATDCTPPLAREERTSVGIEPEIPSTDPAYARWSAGVRSLGGAGGPIPSEKDTIHNCSDSKPTVVLDTDPDKDKIKIKATVTGGTHALDKLTITANGQQIHEQAISGNGTYDIEYKPPSPGSYTFNGVVYDKALYTGEYSITTTWNPQNPILPRGRRQGPIFSGIVYLPSVAGWLSLVFRRFARASRQ